MAFKGTFKEIIPQMGVCGRLVLVTQGIFCLLYTFTVLGVGRAIPHRSDGSLVLDGKGVPVGSELIGQNFSRPEYLWPRPSAVEYQAANSGGSNLSATSVELRTRTARSIFRLGGREGKPVPADLVTASGSGLDPHVTWRGALFQAERISRARKQPLSDVLEAYEKGSVFILGFDKREPLVNVLLANLALDVRSCRHEH